jgi:hypothetical protein
MSDETRKALINSAGLGVVAGMVFAVVQVAAAALTGSPLAPLRMSASVLLGAGGAGLGVTLLAGLAVHVALSALFGLVYGIIDGAVIESEERSVVRQAAIGLLYGLLIWATNFQVLGRIGRPWFLGVPQLAQMALHALFFGLPLALMYVRPARQMRPVLALPLAA